MQTNTAIRTTGSRAGARLTAVLFGALAAVVVWAVLEVAVQGVMEPGFGGQKFIEAMCDKIKRLRMVLDSRGLVAELEVDGGIHAGNAARVVEAGARVLVAGAAVFATELSVKESIEKIRASLR